jgi:hypothetical protein
MDVCQDILIQSNTLKITYTLLFNIYYYLDNTITSNALFIYQVFSAFVTPANMC